MHHPNNNLISISIHALREEGDLVKEDVNHAFHGISIHALREEGDGVCFEDEFFDIQFLSTPSARRATTSLPCVALLHDDFYPRPPRGGRLFHLPLIKNRMEISIHALREEGDIRSGCTGGVYRISIHALREEGDRTFCKSIDK